MPDKNGQGKNGDGGDTHRLLIVDDHPIVRQGIRGLLAAMPGIEICGETGDEKTTMEAMRALHPELVVLDVCLPGASGLVLLQRMLAENPRLKVLILSVHEESAVALKALRRGARGYLMKQESLEELRKSVETVAGGGIFISPSMKTRPIFQRLAESGGDFEAVVKKLSEREREVFMLLGSGSSAREIAENLRLSAKTVETHRDHIKDKVGCVDALALGQFAADWRTATED